jgi:hypothetical protein
MSKPLGLTWDFQVVRPTHIEDAIHEAVEQAYDANMTVKDFIRNVWESWEIVRKDKQEQEDREFRAALK